MNEVEFETAPAPQRPRTLSVVGLLAITAAILSYLGAYAMTNALVAAELVRPWAKDHDPRPRWFLVGFVVLICLFSLVAAAARHASSRQMKEIEQMEAEDAGGA